MSSEDVLPGYTVEVYPWFFRLNYNFEIESMCRKRRGGERWREWVAE